MKAAIVLIIALLYLGAASAKPQSSLVQMLEGLDEKEVSKRASVSGDIEFCFDCDVPCENKLGGQAAALTFFNLLAQKATAIFSANNMGITLSAKHVEFTLGDAALNAAASSGSGSPEANVNNVYWLNLDRAGKRDRVNGCDGMMLLTVDSFFTNHPEMEGYSTVSTLCTEYGFAYAKLSTNIDHTLAVFMHELGHMMGMKHEGANIGSPNHAGVESTCEQGVNTCTASGGNCVMNTPLVKVDGKYPTKYSPCSKAWFQRFVDGGTPGKCVGKVDAGTGGSGEEE